MKKEYDLLGRIDVMLNQLAHVRQQVSDQKASLKTADAATTTKLQTMLDDTDAMVNSLTSSPQNFEDFIQKQGELREDVLQVMQSEPLAQASLDLYARLQRTYAERVVSYGAWQGKIAAWNADLKAAGLKPISASVSP